MLCHKRKVKSGNSAVSSHRKSRNERRKQRRNYKGVMTTENRGTKSCGKGRKKDDKNDQSHQNEMIQTAMLSNRGAELSQGTREELN